MNQKVLSKAVIRNANIIDSGEYMLYSTQTSLRVRRDSLGWIALKQGVNITNCLCDIHIRHLILDPGTETERRVWDARIRSKEVHV